MSTLEQMQAFVAAVEQGSFTAASEGFGISPTALAKKISLLEKSLGVRLLIRTPRLLTMTDIGKKYYDQCKKILHEYKLSHLLIAHQVDDLVGSLNIVCRRAIAKDVVFPLMAGFLEMHPHLVTQVAIQKEPGVHYLRDFDLAIGYEPSDVFDAWQYRNIQHIYFYYPNILPVVPKISAYLDYMRDRIQS